MDEGFFSRWLNTKTYAWLYAAILVNGSLILYTTHVTFQNFPSSPDEYSYQVSAELFSTGRLHIPSPEGRVKFKGVKRNGRNMVFVHDTISFL